MARGTPEVRLWTAVATTMIDDCRHHFDEYLHNIKRKKGSYRDCLLTIDVIENTWVNRVKESSFIDICDIIEIHNSKFVKWIKDYARRSRKRVHLLHSQDPISSLEGDRVITSRGQKRRF